MPNKQHQPARRYFLKKLSPPLAGLTAWSLPLVQSVILPAHAQTTESVPVCTVDDIPGTWQLELLGTAASSSEITLYVDGSADHAFINAWQYSDGQLMMTQGSTWVLMGAFGDCDTLSGTYLNVFTIPVLGNVIIRQGDWIASRL